MPLKILLAHLFLLATAALLFAQAKPVVTEKQKLEIRTAQVAVYQAKEVLESTPQFRAFAQTQNQMNELSLRVEREIGCIPPKWQFTQELECVAIPAPEKKP
jgi:hypothetical protein